MTEDPIAQDARVLRRLRRGSSRRQEDRRLKSCQLNLHDNRIRCVGYEPT